MSREGRSAGSGLLLLGAPVQLASRDTAGVGRRSRPRSAAPRAHTPDLQEKGRRPFSADTKCPSSTIQNLLKSSENREFNFHDYTNNDIKVGPPTAALLENHNQSTDPSRWKPRELRCNASDQGSEDTYVSLGTKIKAKAQVNNSRKHTNKNYLKYRDIARKEQNVENKKDDNRFDFKITILQATNKFDDDSSHGDGQNEEVARTYNPYFLPLDLENSNSAPEPLAGRVSFGNGGGLYSEVEHAIDTYARRLSNKQQLSLVEEESTQDLESMPSQPFSSQSPKGPVDKHKVRQNMDNDSENSDSDHVSFMLDSKTSVENIKPENNMQHTVLPKNYEINLENGPRTYSSFYDDFTAQRDDRLGVNTSLSSTAFIVPGIESNHGLKHSSSDLIKPLTTDPFSLQNPECPSKTNNNGDNNLTVKSDGEIHSSLECIALENTAESCSHKFSPRFACQWNEMPAHSRLQCKEFLSIKEYEFAGKIDSDKGIKLSECKSNEAVCRNKTEEDYPEYLNNSTSKAYTSKVIEDYKKEIEAIDSLHELTLKDIKTEVISPTPLNIDIMFEQIEKENSDVRESPSKRFDDLARMNKRECIKYTNIASTNNENEVANISTRELIQNYFKVKEGEDGNSPIMPKVTKKKNPDKTVERKVPNNAVDAKPTWNSAKSVSVLSKQKNINHCSSPLQKKNNKSETNNEIPLSSRIECVQNDKDVDSWMSMTAPTPRKENSVPQNSLASSFVSDVAKDLILDASTRSFLTKEENITTREFRMKPSNEICQKEGEKSSVLDIYTMLTEIENLGSNPVPVISEESTKTASEDKEDNTHAKNNFTEIFTFLEKVEHSANEALSVITSSAPQVVPKLESLLRLPQTELAQRYVTAALQLEERSCCIALLQESLANHKEQMINKVNNLEKQSSKNIAKVKQECEEAIKRHQNFIDQLISDKKTLNHRIEQLVEERGSLEERWRRSAQALEQRYRLELKNQHDRMAAAQQVARQRWVRQKAEKIKELTVKGLEGELREIAERSSQEMSQLKMSHAEALGRLEVQHAADTERLRRTLQQEHEAALVRERHAASSRMERQIVELERAHAEQRTRLVAELRAEGERTAAAHAQRESAGRAEIERWRQEQENEIGQKMAKLDQEIARQRELFEEELRGKRESLAEELERYKREVDAEMQKELRRRVGEAAAAHKAERDREIERAIESLEGEAQRGRRELQDALRRNKEQYETELRELGETEKATLRRYQEAQARVRQTEDKCAELEATISQLETRNRVLTDKNAQLEGAAEACARSSEVAWRGRLEAAESEMDALRRTHDEQMHQLYAKVKVAVARKDSAIQALTREADKARERVATLEQRLQQQRKDFLKQK